jgi:hypothetical protein
MKIKECVLRFGDSCGKFYLMSEYADILRREKQEQRAERIAREAERVQRYQKRGKWV